MKTEIISGDTNPKQIDWSRPQLVKNEDGVIVAIYGGHDAHYFSGTVVFTPDEELWKPFEFSKNWEIHTFTPITKSITIKFTP